MSEAPKLSLSDATTRGSVTVAQNCTKVRSVVFHTTADNGDFNERNVRIPR